MARLMDRRGLVSVIAYFIVAVPVIASIGFVGRAGSELMLMIIIFFGGFFTLGIQLGLNAISAMIYPTPVRSLGAGWALGIGRLGSILGPIVGGVLIAAKLPIETLYVIGAIPFAVGTIAALALGFVSRSQFGGRLLDDADVTSDAKLRSPAIS
jgi:AAHS family 4-hydroxybenzoate transporter-like MFS transporter